MARGTDKLVRFVKFKADIYTKIFKAKYATPLLDLLGLPFRLVVSPFTLAFDIAGSAPRGFGIPEFVSRLSFSAIFAIATFGAYDIALELGKKVLCQRNCRTCNGWNALQCTMCKGTGRVQYQVKNYSLKSGQKPTADSIAEAVADNRAELVHLPSSLELPLALPTKDCPTCTGSGVMGCPECQNRLQVRISADDIMEPPWKAYNIMKKMEFPYENIINSMRNPKFAEFWLISMPEIVGGFTYDDDVKKKIWWEYKESMRYDQLRDIVAMRKPGWEYVQDALISIDPARARDDPVIVKNIPYYKAKKALEVEVMKLDAPPRPHNWGDLKLPLDGASWAEEDLKDPKKLFEMTTLLNAQREMADKILDAQWETKWRQDKLSELLEEKVRPFIEKGEGILPKPIIVDSQVKKLQREKRRKRWWFF
ncbi:uncharacterized protein LOC116246974 isoform X1 [Nymphaea colorata]|nr:uncharacterized protein LOC116246974 isoform X1 [Nymphaea colorata]